MKIGILTYHRAHNYGAVLQAFALFSTLRSQGYEVEFIDYWPDYRSGQYDLFQLQQYFRKNNRSTLSKLKLFCKRTITLPERLVRHRRFSTFIAQSLPKSDIMYRTGSEIPDSYDVIICGSDQIWRYNKRNGYSNGFDETYFAAYPRNSSSYKMSYAASMGVEEVGSKALAEFSRFLDNFDAISVREVSLLNLVRKASSCIAVQVLDPVFLVPSSSWFDLVKHSRRNRKYLLFYHLLPCPEAEVLAKRVSRERDLEVVEIQGAIEPFNWFSKVKGTAGPKDFVSLVANADFVISTSFHGVAFSIIFRKQFLALGFRNNYSRVKSLLDSLALSNYLIRDIVPDKYLDIEYSSIEVKLKAMVEESLQYLEHNIQQSLNRLSKCNNEKDSDIISCS